MCDGGCPPERYAGRSERALPAPAATRGGSGSPCLHLRRVAGSGRRTLVRSRSVRRSAVGCRAGWCPGRRCGSRPGTGPVPGNAAAGSGPGRVRRGWRPGARCGPVAGCTVRSTHSSAWLRTSASDPHTGRHLPSIVLRRTDSSSRPQVGEGRPGQVEPQPGGGHQGPSASCDLVAQPSVRHPYGHPPPAVRRGDRDVAARRGGRVRRDVRHTAPFGGTGGEEHLCATCRAKCRTTPSVTTL